MKLFITNKPELDLESSSAEIHKIAFATMSSSLAGGFIPLEIFVTYYGKDYYFEFVNMRKEIFFYKYNSI